MTTPLRHETLRFPIDTVTLHARARRARSLAVGDFIAGLPGRIAALVARVHLLPRESRPA